MAPRAIESRADLLEPIQIGGTTVEPGHRKRVEIPIAQLPTETWLTIPVEVIYGAEPGPRLWLSGAVHGDELNGVEITRQVLGHLDPADLKGIVFAVPIVNVFGFITQTRYLPDRRDLNRSFPGSPNGSLAARMAALFMREIADSCTHGIDFHTGSLHRTNLPQVRADLTDADTRRCAEAFQAPVLMHSSNLDGSLRQAATARGIHVLVYEAGETMRFDSEAIRIGVSGTLRVMEALGMRQNAPRTNRVSIEVEENTWIRAPRSGILRLKVVTGQHVRENEELGLIADAFGDDAVVVTAPATGIVLGHTNNPLVNQGDAIAHVARPRTSIEVGPVPL